MCKFVLDNLCPLYLHVELRDTDWNMVDCNIFYQLLCIGNPVSPKFGQTNLLESLFLIIFLSYL